MKNMLPLMQECAKEMVAVLEPHAVRGEVVEMRELLARYTTDVIGTCAFGVQSNSLRNPDAEFRRMGALLLAPSKLAIIKRLLDAVFPKLSGYLPFNRKWKRGSTYFLHAIKNTVKYRETENVERKDFLDLLIQIKKKGTIVGNTEEMKNDAFLREKGETKVKDFEFTDNMLAAQAFIFFIAGFETSSTALSYTLIELSRNPEIQEKLQNEVDVVYEKHGNQFTYEALMIEMSYLDKVLSGERFGLLQTKLGLAMLIRNFKFVLGPAMPYPPVTANTSVIILSTEHGTHLRLTTRT